MKARAQRAAGFIESAVRFVDDPLLRSVLGLIDTISEEGILQWVNVDETEVWPDQNCDVDRTTLGRQSVCFCNQARHDLVELSRQLVVDGLLPLYFSS